MAQLNGLPIFKITFDESLQSDAGMGFISAVDFPAIEKNWFAMGDNKAPMKFNSAPDKQMLYGPILIADQPIYRYNSETKQEYYVVFTADVIEKLVRKFQLQQKTINLNYQHLADSQLKDAVIQEIWITGTKDKSQDFGFDLPKGSAFVAAFIGDKSFWDKEIKSGNVKGFSIEGFLDLELNKINIMKFISAKTDKGIEINSSSETFVVGSEVTTKDETGKDIPLAIGEYVLDNGMTLKVTEAGKIAEVVEVEMTVEETAALSKMFAAVLKPLQDQIAAFQVRLDAIPAGKAATESNDNTEIKLTAIQSAQAKLTNLKLTLNKK